MAQLRIKFLLHHGLSLMAPLAGLIAAIVGTSFFYSINASNTVETLQSWSCRWSDVVMTVPPHFDMLCRQSQAALYMMIALIPLELVILGLAGHSFVGEKKTRLVGHRKSSPALS
jgi:hypothetical protein